MSHSTAEVGLPQHVAIIMDGNGRWAKQRYLPRYIGHQKGRSAVRKTIQYCAEKGVKALTLFAFSTENWHRPEEEVTKLMDLFLQALQKEVKTLHQHQVRLRVIGQRKAFSPSLQQHIQQAELLTQHNPGMVLNIAASYGGRWDIVQAVKSWQLDNPASSLQQLDEQTLAKYLCLADLPAPDLLIRTGGEQRLSNFLIWQAAYAELYFTSTLWPDFDEDCLAQAFAFFAERERRFGLTSEQVSAC